MGETLTQLNRQALAGSAARAALSIVANLTTGFAAYALAVVVLGVGAAVLWYMVTYQS